MKYPREVLDAAKDGLMLWFDNVLPALLPFIAAVNILSALGFVKLVSQWAGPFMGYVFKLPGAGGFALITGLISGYPMGAKTVAEIWREGNITTKEAQRLLAFCNNAGPLFIVGVVGVGMLSSAAAGYALWAGHIAAALVVGILTRGRGDKKYKDIHGYILGRDTPSIGKVLGEAVKNAMDALVLVGGLIIFFSVVVRVVTIFLGHLPFIGLLAGAIEVTNGVRMLADGTLSPVKLAAIGGIIAFGGFSVHAQALHFTEDTGIRAGVYLFHKALNGVIAAGVTWVIWWVYLLYN